MLSHSEVADIISDRAVEHQHIERRSFKVIIRAVQEPTAVKPVKELFAAALQSIAEAEIANVKATLPLVEFDSRLGYEPSMEYMTDKAHIDWKLALLKDVIEKELPSFYEK